MSVILAEDMVKRIYLIGGPPGAGKTTLGTALALRLGFASLTIDDLVTAVQAVTTPDTHPGLHLMWKTSFTDYFTDNSAETLIDDAKNQHEAAWPFILKVIERHANWGTPVVIDGWHLWPEKVAELSFDSWWAGWIHIDHGILKQREMKDPSWYAGSTDPDRMLNNFLARSYWHNQAVKEQAEAFGMDILYQDGQKSTDQLCDEILSDTDR